MSDDLYSVPATKGRPVTPSDSATVGCRFLYIGGAGIVRVQLADDPDGTTCDFTVVAGQVLNISFKRIYATSTTATLMVALF
jgi:hypothetical protein